jgi:hypothetical protein
MEGLLHHQFSKLLVWMAFHQLFLLAGGTSLRVLPPTGWYVDDSNKHIPIRFQCSNNGQGRVIWSFKGEDLTAKERCNRRETRTVCGFFLLISRFQDDYAGEYTCSSPSTGREIHVPLGVQPEFADKNDIDYIAAAGERVDLDCSLKPSVYPPPIVEWQKLEGGALKMLSKGENCSTYTIEKVHSNDSGMYACRATNNRHKPLATQSKHMVLYVYGKCGDVNPLWYL